MNPEQGGVVAAVNQSLVSFINERQQMDVLCFNDPNAPWVTFEKSYSIYALGKGKTAYSVNTRYLPWLWCYAKNYDVIIIDGLWQFYIWGGVSA